ncbi:HYR domain-containing protein [Salegentibacter mishustinae]|uniref:HYR domain-containing protein n=5 Tax=Salegentibacter mishustinae TaxID=270918 RepID=UPI000CCF55A8|nr:HYR domain-containing protein [Salegentibacter mishustinae]PNW22154.1 hypothetical protein APB85_13140 [Salegentibacter mishustinae]
MKRLLLFIAFMQISVMGYAHATQTFWELRDDGTIRFWLEHWHSDVSQSQLSSFYIIVDQGNGQENISASGYYNNTGFGSLPLQGSPNDHATCSSANNYNDWVYYDFYPAKCNEEVTIEFVGAPPAETAAECPGLYGYSVTQTFQDQSAPTITANDLNVGTNQSDCKYIAGSFSNVSVIDNCDDNPTVTYAISGVSIDPQTYQFGLGSTTVTVTATDNTGQPSNNTSTNTFQVNVSDNDAPTFTSFPTNIMADVDSGVCGAVVNYNTPQATDNCEANPTITLENGLASGATFPVGETLVTYKVSDGTNSTSNSFTVTVTDNEFPTLSLENLTKKLTSINGLTVPVSDFITSVGDNCSYTISPANFSFSCADIGNLQIAVTVEDASGNKTTKNASIAIEEPDPLVQPSDGNTIFSTSQDFAVVDASLQINLTDNVDGAIISVNNNFQFGDVLGLPTGFTLPPGVTSSYNSSTGVLTISGTIAPQELQDIFQNVQFSTTNSSTLQREIIFNIGGGVSNSDNDHYYEYVSGSFTWSQAKADAATKTLNGLQGYLATATSATENEFIRTKLSGDGWIGGSDSFSEINLATGNTVYNNQMEAEGKWYWITGPEAATQFSNGSQSVNGQFENWNNGEPNNSGGSEHALQIYYQNGGLWNDLNGGNSSMGYIVEYGGLSGDESCFEFSGTKIIELNTAPQISEIEDIENCPSESYSFTVDITDAEDTHQNLNVTATSDNQSLVTDANISVAHNGTNYDVTIVPLEGIQATTGITITVTDSKNVSSTETFNFTALDDEAPVVKGKDIELRLNENGMAFLTPDMVDNGTYDNCDFDLAVGFSTFHCEQVGENNVTLFAEDPSGNTSFTIVTVTVIDEIAPVVETQPITVQLDANGVASITPEDIDNGSSDNCELDTMSLDITSFDCADVDNPVTVTLTVIDVNGNESSATATVTVEDNVVPVVETQPITVQLDANGVASITPSDIDNGSSDNCEIDAMSLDITSFDCADVDNPVTVTLTVADVNGNKSSATATVTVEDNVAPVVETQPITVQLDANGVASITPEDIDNGSSDNCELDTMSLDITSFDCADVDNPVTVTLTVIDVNGNESSATATVTVEDNVEPIVETQPITVQLDANGVASITPEDIDNGSSDNCEIDTMSLDITSFDCADVDNPVTVTLTVIDVNGNESSSTALVTVEDKVAPIVETQPITVQLDANGVASITPEDIDNGSLDNCEIDTMSLDITSFDCADVDNPVTITLTVIDVNGNESSATATVIVEDNVAPIVKTQSITVQLDANGVVSITPEDIDNGSSDNCEIDTMSLNITEFSCVDVDIPVTVTLTVIDINGNESSSTALVTVEDNVAPVVETQPITVQLDANGMASITPEDIDNGSSDNCEIDTMSLDITSFDCADVDNPVTVTLTVIDVNGNESSSTATVTVEDNVDPTVVTQNITVQLNENGEATITPEDINKGSSDNCEIDTISLDITEFSCTDVDNPVTVTLTVIDVNGNESSATATVIVEDNVAPVPDVAELDDVIVKCEVVAGRITAPTATDNCGVLTATTLDPLTFNQPGSYTITWNFDDGNGNTAMQTQKVIVEPSPLNAVTFEDASFVYDGSEHTLEVKNLPAGASVDYTISSETGTENGAVNAGVYTVTANLSSEFETCPNTELTATLTILKAETMITADATQMFTYDGTQKHVIASLNHSETELSYSPQEGFTEPGTYEINITSVETENYLATTKEVSLVIEKVEITGVTFEGNTEPFVYNGSEHNIFVAGLPEDATVSYTNNGKTNAGTYTVTATVSRPGYEDLVLTANMLIEKASQSITFNEIEALDQLTDEYLQLDATSTSGLPVMYSYTYETEDPAATVGPRGFVRILGGGQITITATQPGNQNYEAATSVVRTLNINGSEARLVNAVINGTTYANPSVDIYYLIGCGNSENEVQIELEQNQGSTIDHDNTFTMSTPAPGIYKETVIVTSEDGNSTKTYHITVEKNFNFEDIVIQKFNNVLLVNNNPETNGGYNFVGYRWYKDGSVIGNGQYYSAGDNTDDQLDADSSYYVVLETEDGEFLRTCTSAIQLRSSLNVALAPNPVSSGGTMELLADFPKDELESMNLSIHNLNGMLIKQMKSNNKSTSIALPYNLEMGVYILKIETKNIRKSLKFIIK